MCKVVFFEFFMQAIMNAIVNGGGKFSTRCSDRYVDCTFMWRNMSWFKKKYFNSHWIDKNNQLSNIMWYLFLIHALFVFYSMQLDNIVN